MPLMQDQNKEDVINKVIDMLNEIEVDGESTQHILNKINMEEQILHQLVISNVKTKYTAKGVVLGNCWGGGKGTYSTIPFEADTDTELETKINLALENGSIDSGMGFESLIGCAVVVNCISTFTVRGLDFESTESYNQSFGSATEEEDEFMFDSLHC